LSFSSGGKVAEVFVKEGDLVNQGNPLVKLDTAALQLARDQAQVSLHQAEVSRTQAKLSEETAAYDLKKIREEKESRELALLQAQIDVASANYSVTTTRDFYTWSDIKGAQADVDQAQRDLDYALAKLGEYIPTSEEGYTAPEGGLPDTEGYEDWQERVVHAQARLRAAKDTLDAMTSGSDIEEVAIKKQQLQAAEMAEKQARKDLEELSDDIALDELKLESARESTQQAEKSLVLANQSLAQAQKQLDEATIIAPFSGVVASVSAKAEETVTGATTIVQLIDISKLELVVELDEIDVPGVKPGQEVIIEADALPDTEFKGNVVYVYPMPREAGGIVLFDVKIQIEVPANSELRVGMTTTVDIIKEKKENVLLVPSRAIYENSEGKTVVKVMVNGQTEEKLVVAGIDDDIQTEIISGLSEGEQVIIEIKKSAQGSVGLF
ncbi:efflux RND transporter periplasmic adaptor subunit, partial [Chloroflexota bacterium]